MNLFRIHRPDDKPLTSFHTSINEVWREAKNKTGKQIEAMIKEGYNLKLCTDEALISSVQNSGGLNAGI